MIACRRGRGVDAYEPFVSIGIALAAGLLIGLEREQCLLHLLQP